MKKEKTKNPMQPVIITESGVARYKRNEIVDYILSNGGIDMNHLACKSFSKDDRTQFAQLIGYSVYGAADLSYFDDAVTAVAVKRVDELYSDASHTEEQIKIEYLESENARLKKLLSNVVDLIENNTH